MDEHHKISENLIAFRKDNNFPISQISDRTTYSEGHISRMESGKSAVSLRFLEKFEMAFGVDLTEYKGEAEKRTIATNIGDNDVCRRILELRGAMTQKEICEKTGLNISYLSKIEHGKPVGEKQQEESQTLSM